MTSVTFTILMIARHFTDTLFDVAIGIDKCRGLMPKFAPTLILYPYKI